MGYGRLVTIRSRGTQALTAVMLIAVVWTGGSSAQQRVRRAVGREVQGSTVTPVGDWTSTVAHCTIGWCKGQDFKNPTVITSYSAATGAFAGTDAGFAVSGHMSGSSFTMTISGGGYVSHVTGTISGDRWTGTWTDSNKAGGTLTGTRKAKKLELSGRVVAVDCTSGTACQKTPLPGVVVTASGTGGGSTTTGSDGRYSLLLRKGTYTVAPRAAGQEFAPASQVVDLAADRSGIDFSTCALTRTTQGVAAPASRAAGAGEPFCRRLSVDGRRVRTNTPLDKLAISLRYVGVGWDPGGGPIQIAWDGKPVKQLPAAASFDGQIHGSEWPHRDRVTPGRTTPYKCWSTLSARQGSVTRKLELTQQAIGTVLFEDNDANLKKDDVVCEGESLLLQQTRGTLIVYSDFKLYVYRGDGTRLPPFMVAQMQSGTKVTTPSYCVRLFPATRGHVTVTVVAQGPRLDVESGPGPCPKR